MSYFLKNWIIINLIENSLPIGGLLPAFYTLPELIRISPNVWTYCWTTRNKTEAKIYGGIGWEKTGTSDGDFIVISEFYYSKLMVYDFFESVIKYRFKL
ncbi:MAG: hypothetical protein ACFFDJ_02235 [Candidatus Odinarchaeota archaeon]